MDYSKCTDEQLTACAELLGGLTALISNLDRGEAGEHNRLALTFAYRMAHAVIVDELMALTQSSR